MAFTLYDATIVEAKTALATLDHILTEAEKQPNSESFLQARLHEDMKPLVFQVQAAAYFSEKMLSRLVGRESVEYQGVLVTYTDLHARIAEAQEDLAQADKDTVNRIGAEVATTDLPGVGVVDITGKAFAMGAVLPNVSFHASIAYAILRKEGVPLGKKDFITAFVKEHILAPQ